MEALIHSNERLDDLCRKGYRLIQDPKLFCFGIDAVLLSDYAKVKRGDRELTVCRELTKKHEEKVQTTFSELLERSRTQEPRGEYVLVICGRNVAEIAKEQQESWEAMPLEAHMAHYESQGIDRKEAMKLVAKDRGVSKRDIYKQLL